MTPPLTEEPPMNASPVNPLTHLACRSRRADRAAWQMPHRTAEAAARARAVTLCDELASRGQRRCRVAQGLGVTRRTVTRWRRAMRHCAPPPLRGRPCCESAATDRLAVLELLEQEGPHLGLPTLRALFRDMPRCELIELQADYRELFRVTHVRATERLTWHKPGRVWAVDHSHPPNLVEGWGAAMLSVRDLASGMQLAWQPVADETADTTVAALAALFDEHGPPLVLKSDNGSAFKSEDVQTRLAQHRVLWLPSPPHAPWYNGGCEAANGQEKRRSAFFAAQRGCDDDWTTADLEHARWQGNCLVRPYGHLGPTHSELWEQRQPIQPSERDQLAEAVAKHRARVLNELDPDDQHHHHHVLRQAVRRALLELGLLTITRRSIPLPLNSKKRDRIT